MKVNQDPLTTQPTKQIKSNFFFSLKLLPLLALIVLMPLLSTNPRKPLKLTTMDH
jgi:hypothetical protein